VVKVLYPVKDILLKKQGEVHNNLAGYVHRNNVLYPINEAYIVKEEPEWVDQFEGKILECYNTFYWGLPLVRQMGSHYIGSTSGHATFATLNVSYYLEAYDIFGDGQYISYDLYGDSFGWMWRAYNSDESSGNYPDYYQTTGLIIGGINPRDIVAPNQVSQYDGNPGKEIITKTFVNPTGKAGSDMIEQIDSYWFPWNWSSRPRPKDMVCWIYDFSFQTVPHHDDYYGDSGLLAMRDQSNWGSWNYIWQGTFNAETARDNNNNIIPHSDATFLPGQSGMRIISNDWKYAPWERYPHLI